MMRKLISYIFICILLIGCEYENPLTSECESDFEMDVVSDLVMDENGYYHIEWLDGYNQTFATLEAVTNTKGYNRIYWGCDSGIEYNGEFIECINQVSYTQEGTGIAQQTMGIWEEMVNDTLTIYAGFEDWCCIQYVDSIKVIVNE